MLDLELSLPAGNTEPMSLKLKNLPIPQAHVAGILIGVLLHTFFQMLMIKVPWIKHILSWPLLTLGMLGSFWAAIEAGDTNIASPSRLIITGPYAYSRNPMYVGWTLIYLGIMVILNSAWLLALLPLVLAYMHIVDVRIEERSLEQAFGSQFHQYKNKVRRYL